MKNYLPSVLNRLTPRHGKTPAGRVARATHHRATPSFWGWLAGAVFIAGFSPLALAQLPGPKLPGSGLPSPSSPKFTPPLSKYDAAPLSVSMQPSGNGPFYIPGVPNCPAQSFRFESTGGYAPITWSHSGTIINMVKNQLGGSAFELVDINGQTGTTQTPASLPLKAAAPSTRLLRYAGTWAGGGVPGFSLATRLSVIAVDGSGRKQGGTFEIRPTRQCGAPMLSGASQAAGEATTTNALVSQVSYTLQVANFDTRDNLDPMRTRETRVECSYPSGLRVDCFDGLRYTGRLGFENDHCPSSKPCRIKVFNLEGSGTVTVRLRNPYGTSAGLSLNLNFPSAVLTENETFLLPSTIAKEAATVTGTPDASDYMGEAAPSCPNTYLVWRGMTYSDSSGRAKLDRPVKIGARVAPSTMPQWKIDPGSNQITLQVSYEVERRFPICQALVVQ
jgi:hypothetical protein